MRKTFLFFSSKAIIWAIGQMDHVDRQTAEQMFRDGSKYAVSKDEVQELTTKLKQRKPSDEEKQERLRKAERAFARFTESWHYLVLLTVFLPYSKVVEKTSESKRRLQQTPNAGKRESVNWLDFQVFEDTKFRAIE